MKLTRVACPQCGGTVEVDENIKTAKCPFCKSAFVIEEYQRYASREENSVLRTKVVEVEPESVQNEINILTFFGWDFKHKSNIKVYDGVHYYKNGNSRDKYKTMVQLTFQRNAKASWCTEELLLKEQRFFDLMKELDKMNEERIDSGIYSTFKKIQYVDNYKKQKIAFPIIGSILFLILFIVSIGLIVNTDGFDKSTIPMFFAGVVLHCLSYVALLVFLLLMFKYIRKSNRERKAFEQEIDRQERMKEQEYKDKKKAIRDEIQEILEWAGKHMKEKFGREISPDLN